MESFTSTTQVELLKNLFEQYNENSLDDQVLHSTNQERMSAEHVGTTKDIERTLPKVEKKEEERKLVDKYTIWREDEVPEVSIPFVFIEESDERETPEYVDSHRSSWLTQVLH